MHPRIREVLDHLDVTRSSLEQVLSEVPPERYSVQPDGGGWSVAEVLEHLAIVEGRVLKAFKEHIDESPAADLPREQDASSVMASMDTVRLVDRTQRLVSGEQSLPKTAAAPDVSWNLLMERRRDLRSRIRAADGVALGSFKVPHARLGALNLYQWIIFLGSHEARHVAQIREVARAVG